LAGVQTYTRTADVTNEHQVDKVVILGHQSFISGRQMSLLRVLDAFE
jgi:hypothetical protein